MCARPRVRVARTEVHMRQLDFKAAGKSACQPKCSATSSERLTTSRPGISGRSVLQEDEKLLAVAFHIILDVYCTCRSNQKAGRTRETGSWVDCNECSSEVSIVRTPGGSLG